MLRRHERNVLIITWVFLMSQWTTLTTREYSFTTCTDSGTFRVIFDISIDRCIEECQRRKRCLAIMFHKGLNECKLKENMNFNISTTDETLCLVVNMTNVDRELGQCNENDCVETDRCESNSNGFKCVKTECLTPNNVSNAYLLSRIHEIGKKNRYKCNDNYYGVGDPSITCTDDGTWTHTTFKCYPRNYENAEVTAIEGEKWTRGTVIHFKCRPGFQRNGANTTSLMNSQGVWEPSVVPCCPDNTTGFLTDSCITLLDAISVGSYSKMFEYCKATGGWFKWLRQKTAEHLFEHSEYHYLMNNIKKNEYAQNNNLTLCLDENMDDNTLANLTNLSYDRLVQEVLSRNFIGEKCASARYWSPQQPNGDLAENCIALSRNDSRMHDVDCNVNAGQSVGFVCTYPLPQIQV